MQVYEFALVAFPGIEDKACFALSSEVLFTGAKEDVPFVLNALAASWLEAFNSATTVLCRKHGLPAAPPLPKEVLEIDRLGIFEVKDGLEDLRALSNPIHLLELPSPIDVPQETGRFVAPWSALPRHLPELVMYLMDALYRRVNEVMTQLAERCGCRSEKRDRAMVFVRRDGKEFRHVDVDSIALNMARPFAQAVFGTSFVPAL